MKTLLLLPIVLIASPGSEPVATNDDYYLPDDIYEEFVPSWTPLYT